MGQYNKIIKQARKNFYKANRIETIHDLEKHLNSLVPNLFSEIDLQPGLVRVYVPKVMVDEVFKYLERKIPIDIRLEVLSNEYDVW